MEQQYKKHCQQKHLQKLQKQKHEFFKQVYSQCSSTLSDKQFEFFTKCIIPQHIINKMTGNINRKDRDSAVVQKQPSIVDINPYVLTMPRRGNFYQDKPISKVMIEKNNKRILTTPTEKIRRSMKFSSYEEYQIYKKMKKYQQKLQDTNKGSKMYCPQPLFYPSNRISIPKIMLHVDNKKTGKRMKTNNFKNSLTVQKNSQAIPDDFVQILRSPKHYTTFRYSKFVRTAKNTKSVR